MREVLKYNITNGEKLETFEIAPDAISFPDDIKMLLVDKYDAASFGGRCTHT